MKTITLGEIMLRLSTPGFERFTQAQSFDATFGGGEANVAVSLANYGFESHFITKLPRHEIGQAAVNHLRRYGVSDRHIVRGGDRVGIYFLETGASQRASKVVYDRDRAAVTTLGADELDIDAIFDGARWFHWTGITPALGAQVRDTLVTLCRAARDAGVTVSCDLNYRKKLWTVDEARDVMRPLMEYVDVCIANEEDAEKSLGMKADAADVEAAELDEASYFELLRKLRDTFGFQTVAVTLRESFSASKNGWSAVMLDDREARDPYRSRRYEIHLVDRVGGGDAFAGGLIAGLLTKQDTREALEFAVAASCLKQTIPGDFNLVTTSEVDQLASGGGSGRVDR
ncbi:MAG: PfkB family carbohydrate kinase [Bacteroidota bacterium]